jgi:hypothetical protein
LERLKVKSINSDRRHYFTPRAATFSRWSARAANPTNPERVKANTKPSGEALKIEKRRAVIVSQAAILIFPDIRYFPFLLNTERHPPPDSYILALLCSDAPTLFYTFGVFFSAYKGTT